MRTPPDDAPPSFEYLNPDDEADVLAALKYVNSHRGQIPPAATKHLNRVLHLLTAWHMPSQPILALLAHHLIHHGIPLPQEAPLSSGPVLQMAHTFGELDHPIARLQDPKHLTKAYRADRLRRLFMTAYTQLEVALLCAAAHIARMQSIELLDRQDARLLATDNEAIFLPLLEMLGMWALRRELGNVSLALLNPKKAWDKIRGHQQRVYEEQRRYYERIREKLACALTRAGVQGEIHLHISPPSSIYRRMMRGEALQALVRQTKIDILVNSEDECYQTLRIIHSLWPPMMGRTRMGGYFQDLIASPKFNGYRTLITTVGYPKPEEPKTKVPIEFRIRTHAMERTNTLGVIAARYLSNPPIVIKNAWWEDQHALELIRDHPSDKIYVFTPTGEVYSLPSGSTPIDYAYRVHTEVGHHCRRIWVNGCPKPYNYQLANGDLVEIEVDPRYPGPDQKWQETVRTSTAKMSIKRALKQKEKTAKGRQIIEKLLKEELQAYKLSEIPPEEINRHLKSTARRLNYPDLQALYLDIADPRHAPGSRKPPSPNQIVARLIASQLAPHIVRADGRPVGVPIDRIKFAQCQRHREACRVTPGSEIVGRIVGQGTPYEHLIVYKKDCPTAIQAKADIPLKWLGDKRPGKPVKVRIETVDRPRLLGEILNTIYDLYHDGLYLWAVHAKVTRDRVAHISLTIDAPSYDSVTRLSEELHRLRENGCLDDDPHIDALSPIEKMLLAEPDILPNPYTTGPVCDRRVFKGRDAEIQQIVSCLRGDQNLVVLYGINRIGKTSLLRYFHDHIAQQYDFIPVLIDMPLIPKDDEAQFWLEMASQIEGAISRLYNGKVRRFEALRRRVGGDIFTCFRHWLADIQPATRGRRLLILVDELNMLDELWDRSAALPLTWRLKSLAESHRELAFVLCVQETLYKKAARTGTEVSSRPLLRGGVPVRLTYLRRHAAEKLIRDPVGQTLRYDTAVVERILHLTACHPYYLQNVLQLLITHINHTRLNQQRTAVLHVTEKDLDAIIPQLLANGEHFFYDFLRESKRLRGTILSALAHISQKGCHGATESDLFDALKRHGYRVRFPDLIGRLKALHEAGIIEPQDVCGQRRYRICIPLFELWLLENRPFGPQTR